MQEALAALFLAAVVGYDPLAVAATVAFLSLPIAAVCIGGWLGSRG